MKGIINIGNTCFISSILQILFQILSSNFIQSLIDVYKIIETKNLSQVEYARAELFLEFLNVLYVHKNNNSVIIPTKFISKIQKLAKLQNNEQLSTLQQNDVNEFLLFLLDSFHELFKRYNLNTEFYKTLSHHKYINIKVLKYIEDSYNKQYSEIYEQFCGIQITLLKPIHLNIAHNKTINPFLNIKSDFYLLLDLYIPPKAETLTECLNSYIKEELLEKENAWFNEHTNQKENVIKQSAFWSFPNILIINLKRAANINNKNRQYINYPINNMDLSIYALNKKCNYVYDLYGVCNHHGHGNSSGHYTSFVKENASNKWYSCNDMIVSEISESQLITPNACMLFYVKKNI